MRKPPSNWSAILGTPAARAVVTSAKGLAPDGTRGGGLGHARASVVREVLVSEGDAVEAGQGVIVIEAMKMENEIAAPKAGSVSSIAVEPGQAVEGGAELLRIE